MATRLKNYSRAWYSKLIVWMIILACSAGITTSFWYGVSHYKDFPYLDNSNYLESYEFEWNIKDYTAALIQKLTYENMTEQFQKELLDAQMNNAYLEWYYAGGNKLFSEETYSNQYGSYTLPQKVIEGSYTDAYYRDYDEYSADVMDTEYDSEYSTSVTENTISVPTQVENDTEDNLSYEAFVKANPTLRKDLKECLEYNLKQQYEYNKYVLEKNQLFQASVIAKEKKQEWNQVKKEYRQNPFFLLYDNGIESSSKDLENNTTNSINYSGVTKVGATERNSVNSFQYFDSNSMSNFIEIPFHSVDYDEYYYSADNPYSNSNSLDRKEQNVTSIFNTWYEQQVENTLSKYQVAIQVSQSALSDKNETLVLAKEKSKEILFYIAIMAMILVIGMLYLIATTGKTPKDNEVHLNLLDSIWSEIQVGIGVLLGFGFLGFFIEVCIGYPGLYRYEDGEIRNRLLSMFGEPQSQILISLITVFCAFLFFSLILSQVRRLKARKWLDGFICIRVIKYFWKKFIKGMETLWTGGRLMNRMMILAIVAPIVAATWIGLPFVIAGLLFLVYAYVPDFERLQEGVKKIKEGDVSYQIKMEHKGVMKEVADDVNQISEGLKGAIESELRSERMKSELISNVSHDIKTPLTSIITYVDLLKKEEIDNETAKDYIAVIEKKAQRLKVLTNDLFEAAKASSGDMPVHLEKVNMQSLVQQALGEFDDKLRGADLEVRVTMPEEPVSILADGRLMWRVTSNLLSNAVKYAQPGSRLYLDVKEEKDTNRVCFIMKNISAYELNIDAEELMERFTRGDESRSTEGSGLGLNIANSLVELQHGEFKIHIDGDLFKVIVTMPKFQENKAEKEQQEQKKNVDFPVAPMKEKQKDEGVMDENVVVDLKKEEIVLGKEE